MMSYQEPEQELFQELQKTEETAKEEEGGAFDSGAIHRLEMLHLNSTAAANNDNPTTTSEAPITLVRPLEKCNSCGSIKRPSLSSFSSLQQPSSKRVTLYHSSTAAGASTKGSEVFTLQINPTSPNTPTPPYSSSNAKQNTIQDFNSLNQILNSQSPENPKWSSLTLPSVLLPLLDPTPSHYQVAATAEPKPPAARNNFQSPTSDKETPNTRRLRRIKKRMKAMNHWVQKVMREEEEDHEHTNSEDNCDRTQKNSKLQEKSTENEPDQKAVWVEKRNGGGLILHFKCPCDKSYEIFLCGNNCYYRLI